MMWSTSCATLALPIARQGTQRGSAVSTAWRIAIHLRPRRRFGLISSGMTRPRRSVLTFRVCVQQLAHANNRLGLAVRDLKRTERAGQHDGRGATRAKYERHAVGDSRHVCARLLDFDFV